MKIIDKVTWEFEFSKTLEFQWNRVFSEDHVIIENLPYAMLIPNNIYKIVYKC